MYTAAESHPHSLPVWEARMYVTEDDDVRVDAVLDEDDANSVFEVLARWLGHCSHHAPGKDLLLQQHRTANMLVGLVNVAE